MRIKIIKKSVMIRSVFYKDYSGRSMESGLTGDEGYARVGPGDKETLATRRPVRIYYCKQLK